MSKSCWVFSTFLARFVPEFPDTPWLDIPADRRAELLEQIAITENTELGGYGFLDRGHPENYFKAIKKKKAVGCIDENASFVLEFDFRKNDDFIRKGFSAWLKSTRARLLGLKNGKCSPYKADNPRRGKARNKSVYWQALKDLSMLRRRSEPGLILKSDTQNPKTVSKMCKRAERLIAVFTATGSMQKVGFVDSLLSPPIS